VGRRDYDADPLSFAEVQAIEQARQRAMRRQEYLAATPLALRRQTWQRVLIQTPSSSTPVSAGTSERELRVPLPDEAAAGAELVVETCVVLVATVVAARSRCSHCCAMSCLRGLL
jgi:uncharacterized protein YfaQ (DUF2300 family)